MIKLIPLSSPAVSRLLGQGLTSLTNLIIAIGVTGVFGAKAFGVVSFILIIANFACNLLRSLLVEPATRLAPRLDELERNGYFVSIGIIFSVILSIVAVPFCLLVGWLIDFFLNEPSVIAPKIASGFILLFVIAEVLRAFYQAFASSARLLTYDICRTFLVLLALFVVLLGIKESLFLSRPELILISQMFSLSFSLLLVFLPTLFRLNWLPVRYSILLEHFSITKMTVSITILRDLQVNAPMFWGQYLLGETVLGWARTWQSLANVVSLPANALRLKFLEAGARRFERQSLGELLAYVRNSSARMVFVSLLMALLVPFLYYISPITGPLSLEIFAYLSLFVAFNIVANVNATLTSAFYASGNLASLMLRVLLALTFVNLFSPALLYYIGGIGIPMSQLLTGLFSTLLTVVMLKKIRSKFG